MMKLVDENTGTHGQDELLTRVYKLGADTIRVHVRVNYYRDQSYATAAVLNADRNWTVIADNPSGNWFGKTPAAQVADRLAERAAAILG